MAYHRTSSGLAAVSAVPASISPAAASSPSLNQGFGGLSTFDWAVLAGTAYLIVNPRTRTLGMVAAGGIGYFLYVLNGLH